MTSSGFCPAGPAFFFYPTILAPGCCASWSLPIEQNSSNKHPFFSNWLLAGGEVCTFLPAERWVQIWRGRGTEALGPGFLHTTQGRGAGGGGDCFGSNPPLILRILSIHLAHLPCCLGASLYAFVHSPSAGHGPWRAWGPSPPQAAPGPSSEQGVVCIPAGDLILQPRGASSSSEHRP